MKPRIQHFQLLEKLALRSCYPQTSRYIHTTVTKQASVAAAPATAVPYSPSPTSKQPALSVLSTSTVLRTLLVTSISSSPILLSACISVLTRLLNSRSLLTDVDKNPMIRWLLKHTFYAQFCAGESRAEVQRTMKALKDVGYRGIILEYALEVLKSEGGNVEKDIETWRQGMIETVQMTAEGDFVGLKWSGLGSAALDLLQHNQPPSPSMDKAIREVCDLASSKGVKLLPAAEETRTNTGIDQWSLNLQKQYNNTPGKVVLYNTYQCYLKATPATLARHLAAARRDGFTLGIKLVRGAYLAAEPEHLTLATKEETDSAYDSIAESLMKRQYGSVLAPLQGFGSEAFPAIDVVLACHNAVSVRKAQALRSEQSARGEPKVPLVYAQLQGMADEVSCELVQAGKAQLDADSEKLDIDVPEVYKCATWGTTGQCLNYLLRRAAENKDAAGRTKESRRAMAGELWRRIRAVAGLA